MSDRPTTRPALSLAGLFARFRWKISLTLTLVLAEVVLSLLFPLFIGWAINDLLAQSYTGIYYLAALGGAGLVIGSARRFYDTRAYARIYEIAAVELVEKEQRREAEVTVVSARTSLLGELVEFFENSMPMLVTSGVSLVGILVVIATLSLEVFLACLALLMLTGGIYWLTGRRNFRYQEGFNDELERKVEALETRDVGRARKHFEALMRWNIRLSDLETWNYALIWLGVIALLVYAPIAVVGTVDGEYGTVFAVLMYVFQFIDSVVALPLFIQQLIRLQEISGRLEE